MIEVLLRECNGEALLRYDLIEERGERENRGEKEKHDDEVMAEVLS